VVQFTLVTASAGPTWQAGQLLALPNGAPATWSLPGDASDWTNNYVTPYFEARQEGGWFSKEPVRLITPPGLDPALCLLIGHLGTTEFSAAGIKEAFHPDFPYDPRGAVIFGMLNRQPPPPPVIVVQQPVMVQYVNVTTVVPAGQVVAGPPPGGYAPMAPAYAGQPPPQQYAVAGSPQMAYAQPMGAPPPAGYPPPQQAPVPQQQVAYAQPYAQQPPPQQGYPPQQAYAQPVAAAPPQQAFTQPVAAAPPPPSGGGDDDPQAQLAKLKGLLDQGLIDQDDYDKKKDQILARL